MKRTLLAIALFAAIGARAETPQQYAALVAQVTNLQKQITAQAAQIAALQQAATAVVAASNQQAATLAKVTANPVLALGNYVYVDMAVENGVKPPNVVFHGCNLHLIDDSGGTLTADSAGRVSGLGNLILGYNEVWDPLQPGDRGASHSLILGQYSRYTNHSAACLIAGEGHYVNGLEAVILGGDTVSITGNWSSAFGSHNSQMQADNSTFVAGLSNGISGTSYALLLGGCSDYITSGAVYAPTLGTVNGIVVGVGGVQ